MDITYFTCTLGQAALMNKDQYPISNIKQFIDHQCKTVPKLPAVGFPEPDTSSTQPWKSRVFSFEDIQRGTNAFENLARAYTLAGPSEPKTVALLCPSTPDFLFAWLGLICLNHPVLLLAPQCQPAAIAHLCKSCEIELLFYDPVYEKLASSSEKLIVAETKDAFRRISLLPFRTEILFDHASSRTTDESYNILDIQDSTVAYLHHTSGTSTGLPKPIPQSHRAALGVLPRCSDGAENATFTTTPLYHGGIADLFRAWTSNALIWLFPGKGVPITAKNIISCLQVAESCSQSCKRPPVKYFSSVPYVLQMMATDTTGLEYLKCMDIVGVGGAALPVEIGNQLIEDGVNLISRFGSAECGFLMSSHRNYSKDKDWQYLRAHSGSNALQFDQRDDGTAELIVLSDWPHRAKPNRPDGSFATADLFTPHSSISNAWKYHSRADSQLTLITGKKFDPAPMESAMATSSLLDDVLIFGNGYPFPGALLFRSTSAATMSKDELIASLAPSIEKINAESQSHARVARNMLVPMDCSQNKLEKSSKGTLLRNKAEDTYENEIRNVYLQLQADDGKEIPDDEVSGALKQTIEQIVGQGESLNADSDLFSHGVDSLASLQTRYFLAQLVPKDSGELPLSVVEDCGTIERLTSFVLKRRRGQTYEGKEDEIQVMHDLVEAYGNFEHVPHPQDMNGSTIGKKDLGEVVILTGATGALGAHVLNLYRNDPNITKIYCLVRGADTTAANSRIDKSLTLRGLPGLLSKSDNINKDFGTVTVLPAKLSDSRLGLSDSEYSTLASRATIIMHLAWAVNFRLRLRSFVKDHIAGTQNLLNLALASPQSPPPRFAFCSSIASVSNYVASSTVPELLSNHASDASPLGYSRSKWVAEQLCARASLTKRLGRGVGIFRVGQLSGDSHRGIWNTKEAWPTMLGSVTATGCLPALKNEPLTWLPVDIAARALVQGAAALGIRHTEESRNVRVYHVLNPDSSATWTDLLTWLRRREEFDVVSPETWVQRLERLQLERPEHPALQLLGLWRNAYGPKQDGDGKDDEDKGGKHFEMEKSRDLMPVLRSVEPVNEEYFGRIWMWIKGQMDR